MLHIPVISGVSQNVYPSGSDLIIENYNYTTGTHNYDNKFGGIISPGTSQKPIIISNDANVTYEAFTQILLEPGFHAGLNFTKNGYFHAKISKDLSDFEVSVVTPENYAGQVGEYEKLEIGIKPPTPINNLVENVFFDQNNLFKAGINPYDPESIDAFALFKSPSGKLKKVNAFYYRDYYYIPNPNDSYADLWVENQINNHFRVRFAPDEIGSWELTEIILDASTFGYYYVLPGLTFNCVNSDNKGNLIIGQSGRSLVFDKNKDPFFGVGENLATRWTPWDILEPWVFNGLKNRYNPKDFANQLGMKDWMDSLSENGGNLISIGGYTGLFCLEWEHLGIYDQFTNELLYANDKTNNTTWRSGNRQTHGWELDHIIDEAHDKGIYIKFWFMIHDIFKTTTNRNYNWNKNPYHCDQLCPNNLVTDFFTNSIAKKYFKKYLRYMIARYGYSTNICWWELLSEIDIIFRDTNYDINSVKFVKDWMNEMTSFIKNDLNDNHLVSASYARFKDLTPSYVIYSLPQVDIIQTHYYGECKNINVDLRFEDAKTFMFSRYTKSPYIFGEMGIINDYLAAESDENLHGNVLHNNIWSTSFMGGLGCGLEYWWEQSTHHKNADSTYNDYYKHFSALNDFWYNHILNDPDLNFSKTEYEPFDWRDHPVYPLHDNDFLFENFWLCSPSKNNAFGWAHNATYYFANLGNHKTQCDDVYAEPIISPSDFIYIDSLKPNSEYDMNYFQIGYPGVLSQNPRTISTNSDGKAKLFQGNEFNENIHDFAYILKLHTLKSGYEQPFLNTNFSSTNQDIFSIFPNPSSGIYTLNINKNVENTVINIDIYNQLGINIKKYSVINESSWIIDLREHPDGVYFAKITYNGNYNIFKLIKIK